MRAAHLWAERSTCTRGQVGAVIVKNDRIISTGYNGSPPHMPHCTDIGCEIEDHFIFDLRNGDIVFEKVSTGCQRCVHAEANAIAFAARNGVKINKATIYCTYSPCRKCAELMASAGIKKMVWDKHYRDTPFELIEDMGLVLEGREYA